MVLYQIIPGFSSVGVRMEDRRLLMCSLRGLAGRVWMFRGNGGLNLELAIRTTGRDEIGNCGVFEFLILLSMALKEHLLA